MNFNVLRSSINHRSHQEHMLCWWRNSAWTWRPHRMLIATSAGLASKAFCESVRFGWILFWSKWSNVWCLLEHLMHYLPIGYFKRRWPFLRQLKHMFSFLTLAWRRSTDSFWNAEHLNFRFWSRPHTLTLLTLHVKCSKAETWMQAASCWRSWCPRTPFLIVCL